MTRVLHIRSSTGFYGAERVLVNLLPVLERFEVDPLLVAIDNSVSGHDDFVGRAREAGVETAELPCPGKWRRRSQRQLDEWAREFDAECIHTHDYKSHLFGYLAARRRRIPLVATLHGWTRETLRLKVYELIERFLLRRFDAVIVVSDQMAESLLQRGFSASKLRTIGNGVNTEQFHPDNKAVERAALGLGQQHFVFGTIGRLSQEKGQDILVRAFARVCEKHPGTRLLLVGEGPEESPLRALVEELAITQMVVFAGRRADVEHILPTIDCCVSPSWTEGMPLTILEAMASQRPIIATDVGSVGTLLKGGAGFLVGPGDIEGLAALMIAVASGEKHAEAVAAAARKRSVEKYNTIRQAQSYSEVYARVCGNSAFSICRDRV